MALLRKSRINDSSLLLPFDLHRLRSTNHRMMERQRPRFQHIHDAIPIPVVYVMLRAFMLCILACDFRRDIKTELQNLTQTKNRDAVPFAVGCDARIDDGEVRGAREDQDDADATFLRFVDGQDRQAVDGLPRPHAIHEADEMVFVSQGIEQDLGVLAEAVNDDAFVLKALEVLPK